MLHACGMVMSCVGLFACMHVCGSFRTSICVYCTHSKHMCLCTFLYGQRSLAHTHTHTHTTQVNRNVFYTVCLNNRELRTMLCWNGESMVRPTIYDHFILIALVFYFFNTLCFEWFLVFELVFFFNTHTTAHINIFTLTHTNDVCTAYKLLNADADTMKKNCHCICSLKLL